MNLDFIFSPDQDTLTEIFTQPVVAEVADPSRAAALGTFYLIAEACAEDGRTDLSLPLSFLAKDLPSHEGSEYHALYGFEIDAEGTPGWFAVFRDMSCLIMAADKNEASNSPYYLRMLPGIFRINPVPKCSNLNTELSLHAPTGKGKTERKQHLCLKDANKTYVPLLSEAAHNAPGIDQLVLKAYLATLNVTLREWVKSLDDMPLLKRFNPGEGRMKLVDGNRYAWPRYLDWSNFTSEEKSSFDHFVGMAMAFMMHKYDGHILALHVSVQSSRPILRQNGEERVIKSLVNFKAHLSSSAPNEPQLENEFKELLRHPGVPLDYHQACGSELVIFKGTQREQIISRAASLAFRTFKTAPSAHETIAAIAFFEGDDA